MAIISPKIRLSPVEPYFCTKNGFWDEAVLESCVSSN